MTFSKEKMFSKCYMFYFYAFWTFRFFSLMVFQFSSTTEQNYYYATCSRLITLFYKFWVYYSTFLLQVYLTVNSIE